MWRLWHGAISPATIIFLTAAGVLAAGGGSVGNQLSEIPAGYNLQFCDDCGVPGRQPHVPANTCHTFPRGTVAAELKARSVTYGTPNFDVVYEGLSDNVAYVLAVTYASDRNNKRTQSLSAGSIQLHGPRTLPDGSSERLIFEVPVGAIRDGRLELRFTLNSGPNAVASVLELWAPLPSPAVLHLDAYGGTIGQLRGRVFDIAYEGVAGAEVIVSDAANGVVHAATTTSPDGSFEVDVSDWVKPGAEGTVRMDAKINSMETSTTLPFSRICFAPRFTPIGAAEGPTPAPILLDGVWRINPSPSSSFQTEPTAGPNWSDFTVPGQWLQQGFDIPRDQTVAVATDFQVPAGWSGKRIFLRFDAVHSGADYWLNGVHLGYSENLMTPIEFDITDAARPGQSNHLTMGIKVQTPSELASYTSDYAFHNLGGIDRSVHLFALPAVHLSSLHHGTSLDAAYRDATLSLEMDLNNTTASAASGLSMRISLTDPDGGPVPLADADFVLDATQPGITHLSKHFQIPNPRKWSAEKPWLYDAVVELHQSGDLLERLEQKVGFRKVEVRDSQLWVNGVRVKLAGTNRHEIDPITGRAATAVHAEEDARLLRDANYNYIRTAHYPPTREFLDACDRIGVYVECEAPFCWTRGRGEDDPALTGSFASVTARMIDYHRDHPSVIIWSLGNESGSGPDGENSLAANFAAMLALCRSLDPSRPVIFSNEWSRDGGACDIACVHYPPFPVEEYPYVKDDPRPILIDEYFPPQTFTFADELRINPGLDVLNWSTGQNSPTSYWSQIYASSRLIGGATWAGIDEEFLFADGSTKGYGAWGFVDVWRRPKSLWWDAKRIHSPVWIPVRRVDYAPGQQSVSVPVENRYSFTDLGELSARWELADGTGDLQVSLAPGSTGLIGVPVPADTPAGSLLVLRFFDSESRLVTAAGVTLGDALPSIPPAPSSGCPRWRDDGGATVISGKSFGLALDRATGEVRPEHSGSSTRLLKFPRLFVSRQETKNAFNPDGVTYAQFPDEATRAIDSVTIEPRGQALAIVVRDHYADYSGYVEMLIDDDGVCTATFDYTYTGAAFTASEVGLRFLMDKSCQEISWQRRTEWDVYPDDHIGRPEGRATAYRGTEWSSDPLPYNVRPPWPWHLDSNEYGTRDFRASKYNIYEAKLLAPDGSGIRADSNAAANVRACLAPDGVQFHVLLANAPGQVASGSKLTGSLSVGIVAPGGVRADGRLPGPSHP